MIGNVTKQVRGLVLAVCLASVSCEGSALLESGESPEGELVRARIVPDAVYATWWDELQSCSGASADFGRIRFFRVVSPLFSEDSRFPCGAGFLCNGMWESPHDISLAPTYLGSRRLVKHEMLHDLLETIDHPPVFDACDASWDFSDVGMRRGATGRGFPIDVTDRDGSGAAPLAQGPPE